MVRGRIQWSAEEEATIRDGVTKYGVGKWHRILDDPEFSTTLQLRTNVDLKDKWRYLTLRKGECQNGYKPHYNIKKASSHFNKFVALTSEARGKDEIAQPDEAPAIFYKSSEDGDSNKLMSRCRFDDGKLEGLTNAKQPSNSVQKQEKLPPLYLKMYSRRNKKTVTTDGKVNKETLPPPNLKTFSRRKKKTVPADGKVNKREMEYDATDSESMQATVDVEPMRIRHMSAEDPAAADEAALKEAEASSAEADEAEKETAKAECAAKEAKFIVEFKSFA